MPYWVSLVPYAIAQGPEPPNVEDLQHQRDVLKQCARMRSQTLDRLNQVEYILDPLHTPEFNIQPPPSGPDLPALHAGLSADLDMIAAAASWACDHPKEAMDPETFAHTHQIVSVPGWINPHFDPNYKMTILPTNMPLHVGVQVLVPDFSIARSFDEATKIASDSRLNLHWDTDTNVVDPNFRILNQDPARATPVSWGSTVILTVPDNGLHFPPGWHPGGGGIHFRANGLLLSKDVPHRGFSLHIGLNGVDASKYNGWAGTLAGCVNDANAMQSVCRLQGFDAQTLLNSEATADAILGAIGQAAFNLQSGETLVLSFSGHGGQVPDITGISPSGLDDTWVAYDRMILGHELYNLWGQFASDVRIEVYSDSCHSGTVIRDLFTRWPTSTSKAIPSFLNGPETQNFQLRLVPV